MKHLGDDEYLLKKNSIKVNSKKSLDDNMSAYLLQRPNTRVLEMPISLSFYNLGDRGFIDSYDVWKDSFPKKERRFSKLFSEKQSRGYRNFKSNTNQWYFKKGEAPVILDSIKTNQTVANLEAYFKSQGFFRATVDYSEELLKNKRATVEYNITSGAAYVLDSLSYNISSQILDTLYEANKDASFLIKGEQYRYQYFENEADRVFKLYRNSGIYHFNRNSIDFDVDTTMNNYSANVKLNIDDRLIQENDSLYSTPYRVQKISKIDIYTDYSFAKKNQPYSKSEEYNSYTFYAHDKLRFNSRLLANSLFIYKDSIYRDIDRDYTRNSLRTLKNFKLVEIKYTEINEDSLEVKINLTPYQKFSLAIKNELTHSNIKQMGVSGKLSVLTKNVFRGAEILDVSVQGSFFNSTDVADQEQNIFFNAWEFGADVSLEIPRIFFPLKTSGIIPKHMTPRTDISLGTSFQKNIGLDKQLFTSILGYNWQSNRKTGHRFELINTQYIKNLNPESYFNIYTSEYVGLVDVADNISDTTPIPPEYYDVNGDLIPLPFMDYVLDPANNFENTNPQEYEDTQNINKRYDILTENVLIPSISYQYTYNTRENFKDRTFYYFRGRVALAGGMSTFLGVDAANGDHKEIAGLPIAQYLKLDLEYKKFWGLSNERTLAYRSFLGIAMPYGKSSSIPFNRSYFIGGANDLRAWKIYDLGPGSSDNNLEYNVGTLKFLTSLEYRFDIINSLKGAIFADAGNIWDITGSDLTDKEGRFKGFDSLKEIALGTGFGVRYDFSFLIVRFDMGFKTYEPYLKGGDKWFSNYNFGHSVFNFGINYPF